MQMATDAPKLSKRLKELREREGEKMTQQELATAAGLSLSVVAQIEQGKIPDPRLSTLRALAKALNVPVLVLIGEEEAK